ncbi:golgi uridine diphosphate-N- acetylglucosamine transporter [Coemansia spiralis]|uniref:Golgi uridine diphosphate-N- acetylglucosamine transporter n=2 Tax=Coemansia TaxID=4863 RepID=A0A9W8G4M3_9FUNG|nr:golgi uridine diphosphate-N- acetylglucosamine transporter [Coemansia umbellata]KAJ2619549.1 golgi uridine diphosphate-N- acetylglucosamine transporter [Coemansia sp. RSA 1358]KAJ2671507.1 golgi uridine diphosphate-N- acetylglucosamine transporter [Coemansia spiralis]
MPSQKAQLATRLRNNHLSQKKAQKALVSALAADWLLVLSTIFGGCCTNVFALESLVREVPKCGNLITFGQFVFITLVGLPSHLYVPAGSWLPRLRPRKVPLRRWLVMVVLYFGVSAFNNIALGFRISIPLHIVFRSSGLIANMVCGYMMGKRYPARQAVAVVMVSVGVVVATLASVGLDDHSGPGDTLDMVIGIVLLSLSVVLAALLGLYQESTYVIYGKHWQEGLFYNHLLALPMFVLFRHDIYHQAQALSQSQPVVLDSLPVVGPTLATMLRLSSIPYLWISLLTNIFSQLLCASGVHKLTTMSTSLTLNVVLNFRKLVSLVLSVIIFRNPITGGMVFGCALVFLGTFTYSQSSQNTKPRNSKGAVDTAMSANSSAQLNSADGTLSRRAVATKSKSS